MTILSLQQKAYIRFMHDCKQAICNIFGTAMCTIISVHIWTERQSQNHIFK